MNRPTENQIGDLLKCIGKRVRERRMTLGLTRHELSDLSGVSLRYLAQLEKGDGNISVGRLFGISRALDLPMMDLLQTGNSIANQEERFSALF